MVKKAKVKKESAKAQAARVNAEAAQAKAEAGFGVSLRDLNTLNEDKDVVKLHKQYGGVEGLASALHVDTSVGLSPAAAGGTSMESRQAAYGANRFKAVPLKSFFRLLITNLKDPTLILLMAAALISTVLGSAVKEQREESAWSEGVAIWVAVIVVSGVGAVNDYQKDLQFKKLNAQKDVIEVKVLRNGDEQLVGNEELCVGDILILDTGDKVTADGIYITGHGLVIDEAALTGESEPLKKNEERPFVRSGTQVTEGDGRILISAVGEHSEWGQTMALVVGESQDTPLQEKLTVLAAAIGKVGLSVAVLCFVVLMIRWMIENKGFPLSEFSEGPLQFFIFSVTILVVAVPEGLPLAVTISLAFSMKKMMKDNNFVRVLAACETMGGASAICSDKTGTLTENRMTVVEGWFSGKKYDTLPAPEDMPESAAREISLNSALNSKAFLIEDDKDHVEFVGNRTECALLMMLRKWGISYKELRAQNEPQVANLYGFSSAKKMASVLLRTDDGFRLYNKGAAEYVLKVCTRVLDTNGVAVPLGADQRAELEATITQMASRGLRTLCLSYTDFPASAPGRPEDFFETSHDEDLTMLCIVGIKDPVRAEVPDAVAVCKRAGITVRMVTGDNTYTAQHIARECGILSEGGIALEGPDFRNRSDEELKEVLPKVQVLARSSPADKFKLVHLLKEMGEVVAVTGDGTNDAPALKESDVGLAMGIAGTEVAKEAADIVILDDNFRSIVKAVLWGRSVFNNIRKFLMFQLTVNFVALVVAFVAAVGSGETPLNVLQLLWVNLIMDSLGALALATEDPTPDLLLQKPAGRRESLINGHMWCHILTQGFYQMFWLFLILYGLPTFFSEYELPTQGSTAPGYLSYAGVMTQRLPTNFVLPPGIPTYNNDDGKGPRIDLCCLPGSDCLATDPNFNAQRNFEYLNSTEILCEYKREQTSGNTTLAPPTKTHEAPSKKELCGENPTADCTSRQNLLSKLHDQADKQWENVNRDGRNKVNSVIFNVFIMCQMFNFINARKLNDDYNIFEGILHSHIFIAIWIFIGGAQIIFMEVLGGIFKVVGQNWKEWLAAIAIGAGAMVVAFLTKVVTRCLKPKSENNNAYNAVQAL
jgi:Ca2+-transporting ATPase